MSWGRHNRLSRIFDPASGRTNMLAVDHGYSLRAVVHDGRGVDDAVDLYERLAGQPVPAGR
jgi:DhnA family fructose-bisphosphate aldolase class Ia